MNPVDLVAGDRHYRWRGLLRVLGGSGRGRGLRRPAALACPPGGLPGPRRDTGRPGPAVPDLPAVAAHNPAHRPGPGQGHVRVRAAPPGLNGRWEPAAAAIEPLAVRIAELEELAAACTCDAGARAGLGTRYVGDRPLTTAEAAEMRAAVAAAQALHDSIRLAGEQLAGAVLDQDHPLIP